jgi:outer membrane autotransporter protein
MISRPARTLIRFVCVGSLAVPASVSVARAGDLNFDVLRGSETPSYSRWDGPYLGVNLSHTSGHAEFDNSTSDLVAYILRNTTIENEGQVSQQVSTAPATSNSVGFGAFIGYNFQIEPSLVIGFEANYTKFSSLNVQSSDTLSRSFMESNNVYRADYSVTTDSSIRFKDYGTLRARAGYVMGQFMPYAYLGLAGARVDISRSATVYATETPNNGGATLSLNPNPTIRTDVRNNTFAVGAAAGIGIEASIAPNLFLRAEYEYAVFSTIGGIRPSLQTGRVGVGFKF